MRPFLFYAHLSMLMKNLAGMFSVFSMKERTTKSSKGATVMNQFVIRFGFSMFHLDAGYGGVVHMYAEHIFDGNA
jgi:hypothetical protein